ncbi:hypothetical protein ACFX13_004082 [Malus domestica]
MYRLSILLIIFPIDSILLWFILPDPVLNRHPDGSLDFELNQYHCRPNGDGGGVPPRSPLQQQIDFSRFTYGEDPLAWTYKVE